MLEEFLGVIFGDVEVVEVGIDAGVAILAKVGGGGLGLIWGNFSAVTIPDEEGGIGICDPLFLP